MQELRQRFRPHGIWMTFLNSTYLMLICGNCCGSNSLMQLFSHFLAANFQSFASFRIAALDFDANGLFVPQRAKSLVFY
jgi:hypothetical protein